MRMRVLTVYEYSNHEPTEHCEYFCTPRSEARFRRLSNINYMPFEPRGPKR